MKKVTIFSILVVLVASLAYVNAQQAKDFQIYNYDTQTEWKLSDYLGKKIICLISGSFC